MQTDYFAFLRLMQLADSALPVGAAAHSFGLDPLVAEGSLDVAQLEPFLREYLQEAGDCFGTPQSLYCRATFFYLNRRYMQLKSCNRRLENDALWVGLF
jgi:urease accessory protein UreF